MNKPSRQALRSVVADLADHTPLDPAAAWDRVLAPVAREMAAIRGHPLWPALDHAVPLNGRLRPLGKLLQDDDALAYVYQALNGPALEAAYRSSSREGRRFTHDEIPAITQLFTPRWVADFLVHNTLGRLWLAMRPASRLRRRLRWLVQLDVPEAPALPQSVRDVRVLDPACGTMNFGLAAFDLLHAMYLEESDRAGESGWQAHPPVDSPDDIPAAILKNNLFGIDIDPLALRLAEAALRLKSGIVRAETEFNLWQGDALFDEALGRRCTAAFDVVVTNPPYAAARTLPADHVTKMKKEYPAGRRDLYACFIQRCLDFTQPGGRAGLLAMQSFMFTGSFEALRKRIDQGAAIETLAHFGPGLFDVGNPGTLQTAAFVLRREMQAELRASQTIVSFRLVETRGARSKQQALISAIRADRGSGPVQTEAEGIPARSDASTGIVHRCRQSQFAALPRRGWAYWVGQDLRDIFDRLPRLGDLAPPRQGLATTDNKRFVRWWWEVEPLSEDAPLRASPLTWFPYAKGGQFRRWYEAPRHRVNWKDDGREIKAAVTARYPYLNGRWEWVVKNSTWYGRPGVTWSYLTSGTFSARRLEEGSIFDVAGSSLFPADPLTILGVLNSSVATRLLGVINPTVNFQVGDLAALPIPASGTDALRERVARAIALQQELDGFDETAPDFVRPMPWTDSIAPCAQLARLAELEREIDSLVASLYGLPAGPANSSASTATARAERARRWVSFAIGLELGRWGSKTGASAGVCVVNDMLIQRLREHLVHEASERAAEEVEDLVGGIDAFLRGGFFPWHLRLYRRHPIYWMLRKDAQGVFLRHDCATPDIVEQAFGSIGAATPPGWKRSIDRGIREDLAELSEWCAC